ncbi:hypothetical protein R1flu_018863 [Riccia fluitans]|uniref:Uncharacterized protein n=1 Tax=Riccia fluitans TaxID=41844 RepID=A0ABD1ZII2_9MARC
MTEQYSSYSRLLDIMLQEAHTTENANKGSKQEAMTDKKKQTQNASDNDDGKPIPIVGVNNISAARPDFQQTVNDLLDARYAVKNRSDNPNIKMKDERWGEYIGLY